MLNFDIYAVSVVLNDNEFLDEEIKDLFLSFDEAMKNCMKGNFWIARYPGKPDAVEEWHVKDGKIIEHYDWSHI